MTLISSEAGAPVHFTGFADAWVELWFVRGLTECLAFPTKMVAEKVARERFPDEDPDTRYGRIYYRRFAMEGIE